MTAATSAVRFPRLYLHIFASAACVLPVASYVLSTFGWRPGDIGVGTALLGLAGTACSPLWGWLDDRTGWGPRAALLLSAAAAVTAALTLGRLSHPATWVALAFFGAASGPLDALLTTRVLSSGLHGSRLGRVRAWGSVGWVVGLALAASVLTVWPQHADWVLFAAALAAITAPRSWGTAGAPGSPAVPGHGDREHRSRRGRLPLREVCGVLAFTFATSVTMSALVQFTAGWAHQELSAGPFLALTPIALAAALELPAFPLVDRLAHRLPPLLLVVCAGPPLALATAALALLPSDVTMIAVQPLVAASFALWFVGQSRMLADAAPAGRHSSAQTLGSALSTGFAGLLAGTAGGHLADLVGYGGLFGVLGVLSLLGTVPGVVVLGGQRLRASQRERAAVASCADES